MCPAAARLHDPVAHTSMLGMIAKMGGSLAAGILIGAAVSAGALFAVGLVLTGPVGLAALIAINLSIGFAVSLALEASGVNEYIDRTISDLVDNLIPKSIEGYIVSGSANVRTNSRRAARAASPGMHDQAACAMHGSGPPPLLAQGSDSVFINDHPAARMDDMVTCGGAIAAGSDDVFIGGATVQVRDVEDERPWLLRAAGVAIGVALMVCGKGRISLSGLKAALPCLMLNFGASMLGSAAGHAIRTTMGHPVNVITGGKVLREEADFVLPGPLPLVWERFYSSHDRRGDGLLGVGWSVACEVQLTVERDAQGAVSALHYCDDQGRVMTFPPVAPGESHYSTAEGYYLIRTGFGQYLVQGLDGLFRDFGVPRDGFAGTLKMERLEDRNGNWHAFRHDAAGQLCQINDGCGRRLDLVYDLRHPQRVAEVRLVKGAGAEPLEPLETLVRYRYTAQGELAEVIDRGGRTRRQFAYRNGLMTEHRVPAGLCCQYAWSGAGAGARVERHWTDDGEAYRFDYDLAARQTSVTDQLGRVYRWSWSDDRQPTSYTDPEGHLWRYAWDANRQLVSLTDPLGAVTRWEYDEAGRLCTTINALDQIEETEWDAHLDLPLADTDAAGNRWTYTYDERGNLLVVTDPEGHETEQAYDSRGLPHTIRDARGGYQHMEWDLRGQMAAYTDCSGKRTSIGYDQRGELARLTDALGNATIYRMDADGRVGQIERADGSVEKFSYDALGRMDASIDPAGHSTAYQRNARGQLLRRIDALGHSVKFCYDAAHRLERLVNENGEAYRFVYDRNDKVIEEIGLDGTVRRIDYDARGLPVALTDAAGEADALTQAMQRDALGRLVARHVRGRSSSFRYDQVGQLLQAQHYTDHGGRRTVHDDLQFAYSKRGEVLSEAGHMGTLSHRYDELGNRVATTLPDGRVINSLYYGSGHLHQLNIDGALVSDFERDDLHREVARSQGQLSTRFEYDPLGRKRAAHAARALSGEPVLRKEWLYDAAGEVWQKRHSRHGVTSYAYDALGRIKSSVSEARRELFGWDAAANLVDSARAGGYVRHNRVLVFEDKRFEYDVHGRLERKRIGAHTEQQFSYDGEHRLREVETVRAGVRQRVCFDYDALGRRISKTDAFGTTLFLWDGVQMVQERRGSDVATYVYEPDSHAPLARIDSQVGAAQLVPARSEDDLHRPSSRDDAADRVYYFHNDVSGIPEELTNSEGGISWQAQYTSWGSTVSESWTAPQQDSAPQTLDPLAQNLRFQGQYLDRETGLHYNTFRFYDPDTGRFISPDPIGLAGGINLQRYAPNPLGWVDPFGWACWTTERRAFWKAEVVRNPHAYSPANQARMARGLAPMMRVTVVSNNNRGRRTVNVSAELHHVDIPQRVGGTGVHHQSNLKIVTPWEHAAIDPYRHTGTTLKKIVLDFGSWQ